MYDALFSLHADFLKALAHPKRLEIVQLLRNQELPVTDIHTMLDLPQANISQHLMLLREASIVTCRKEGKHIFYSLAHPNITKACDMIRDVLVEQYQNSPMASHLLLSMQDLLPIVQDPVCGMRLSPKTASFHYHLADQDYYFCASGCLKAFTDQPGKYVKN